jgi:hypothetical protein
MWIRSIYVLIASAVNHSKVCFASTSELLHSILALDCATDQKLALGKGGGVDHPEFDPSGG